MRPTIPVSAVIPTYNRAAFIGRAIESVLAQSVLPAEIIVVDDGSTDDTAAVCAKYARSVRYVRQENRGASASRNHGVDLASNPWIAFLDSDDYWTPDHLSRMDTAIRQTGGDASLYFADMAMPEADGGGTLWGQVGFHPTAPIQLVADGSAWALMHRQPMMLQTSIMPKAAIERLGGLDLRLRLVHDSFLFCQLAIGGPTCAVSGVGCIQTSDDGSVNRITSAIPLGSAKNVEETSVMWADVLQHPKLSSPFDRLVECNLASSLWTLGIGLIRNGRYWKGVRCLFDAVKTDQRLAWWMLRHFSRKGYETTIRPPCAEVAFVQSSGNRT